MAADRTVEQGAATSVWACLAPEVGGADFRGAYLKDCAAAVPSAAALDPRLQERFWEVTQERLDELEVAQLFARADAAVTPAPAAEAPPAADAPPDASASPGTSASEAATTGAEARSVSDDDSVEKPIDPEVLDSNGEEID